MSNQIKPFSAVTDQDIQDWKARYGDNINLVEVEGGAKFYIKPPGRSAIDLVAEKGTGKQIVEANRVLIANSVLGGDIDVMDNDGAVYGAVLSEVQKLLKKKTTAVKKV